jgi:hypothetical protein
MKAVHPVVAASARTDLVDACAIHDGVSKADVEREIVFHLPYRANESRERIWSRVSAPVFWPLLLNTPAGWNSISISPGLSYCRVRAIKWSVSKGVIAKSGCRKQNCAHTT